MPMELHNKAAEDWGLAGWVAKLRDAESTQYQQGRINYATMRKSNSTEGTESSTFSEKFSRKRSGHQNNDSDSMDDFSSDDIDDDEDEDDFNWQGGEGLDDFDESPSSGEEESDDRHHSRRPQRGQQQQPGAVEATSSDAKQRKPPKRAASIRARDNLREPDTMMFCPVEAQPMPRNEPKPRRSLSKKRSSDEIEKSRGEQLDALFLEETPQPKRRRTVISDDEDEEDPPTRRPKEEILVGLQNKTPQPKRKMIILDDEEEDLPSAAEAEYHANIKFLEPWKVQASEFKNIPADALLGNGGFGSVFRAVWRGTTVAVKFIAPGKITSAKWRQSFVKEAMFMCRLRHPNIVQFLGCCFEKETMFIVMELMPRTLKKLISELNSQKRTMLIDDIKAIAIGILRGIAFMHSVHPKPIIHRDLKPANILLDNFNVAKIGDFGISKSKHKTMEMTKIGTPHFIAPEIINEEDCNEKVDIFSFGMILYNMLTGHYAFKNEQNSLHLIRQGERPGLPTACPQWLRKLISDCWSQDPDERPSAKEVLKRLEQPE